MIKHFKSDDSSQSLLNEETEKATFKVLNKLTENKNFFANDLNIQELCYLLVERIVLGIDPRRSVKKIDPSGSVTVFWS